MLNYISLDKILFLDIETVPMCSTYDELPEKFVPLWDKKAGYLKREEEDTPSTLFPRAGIYAEFGKVVCISFGMFNDGNFRIKSFYGDDEKALLTDFANLLESKFSSKDFLLCAHNGKEFDFPYLSRRMLINSIPLPEILDLAGKKPWEVAHIDTMELWKFGDFKNYTSLEVLSAVFDIPTPKDDIDGSQVGKVYWEDKDLERIVKYCQKDVLAIAQLFLRYQGKELLDEEQVVIV
ncbi:MAG: 3'-5' exonuclease [Bacteroidales bacterium]|nr:3'-5' exonuclease [Bacteroidales bacterium]MCK5339334.1 3'-5' exonuclease [Bacteroidales bacterium]